MYEAKSFAYNLAERRNGILIPIAVLIGLPIVAVSAFLLFGGSLKNPFPDSYILPWTALAAIVILTPAVYLTIKTKRFDITHPLVFAACTYYFHAFVLGGLILAANLSIPYFFHFIQNPQYHIPLALVYASLGYAALTLGFALPPVKKLGSAVAKRLPGWNWNPNEVLVPGVFFLLLGLVFNFMALTAGILGYQRLEVFEAFDTLIFFLTYLGLAASFVLWLAIFRAPRITIIHVGVIILLLSSIPFRALLAGNRGGLISNLIPIILAFWMSGRKIRLRHVTIFGVLGAIALIVGMAYGTTYRSVKGSSERVSVDQFFTTVDRTFDAMLTQDFNKNFDFALQNIYDRLEVTSSLAVVVSNYEKLQPYEKQYGLENNIWTYTWTAFIPRFVWPDKPLISDGSSYSDLYFDYGENSFAVTCIGDLLRNFGPLGVPLGMMVLGCLLRFMYASLVEDQPVSLWRSATYYILLSSISYEGFYGVILPSLIRVGFIMVLFLIAMNFIIGRSRAAA
jgi:hypothetical protein